MGLLYSLIAAASLVSGCISIGGGTALNVSVDGSTVRRVGGAFEVGNFVEIVEDRVVAKAFYEVGFAPLGARSGAVDSVGALVASTQRRGLPGLYVTGAYGENDTDQHEARLAMFGAGVVYARHDARLGGRVWTAIRGGLAYHRQRQLTANAGEVGHFLGLEITVDVGYDVLGPMFTSD